MIKIQKERLESGIVLLDAVEDCLNSHNCLWIQRSGLFILEDDLPEDCPRAECPVIIFRKRFEAESPAFYAEALRLSLYDHIVNEFMALAKRKKGTKKKKGKGLRRKIRHLRTFGGLLAITLDPLFLEAGEIPFLKTGEIAGFRDHYYEEDIRKTAERMDEINHEWLDWVYDTMTYLPRKNGYYAFATVYLVYLFLKGLEKTQLPDLEEMSNGERAKFFSEIEQGMTKK